MKKYFFELSKEEKEELLRDKNKQSTRVIKYFLNGGCCFGLFGMKDKEYLELVSEFDKSVTEQVAASKLGIDLDDCQEIQPIRLAGYKFSGTSEYFDFLAKRTDDGQLISSVYEVTYLLFSNEQLYMYSQRLAFHSNASKKQDTNEFFYKDVVSVGTTDHEAKSKIGKVDLSIDTTSFILTVPGDKISVAMDANDETESTIQGMKQKLREKKA